MALSQVDATLAHQPPYFVWINGGHFPVQVTIDNEGATVDDVYSAVGRMWQCHDNGEGFRKRYRVKAKLDANSDILLDNTQPLSSLTQRDGAVHVDLCDPNDEEIEYLSDPELIESGSDEELSSAYEDDESEPSEPQDDCCVEDGSRDDGSQPSDVNGDGGLPHDDGGGVFDVHAVDQKPVPPREGSMSPLPSFHYKFDRTSHTLITHISSDQSHLPRPEIIFKGKETEETETETNMSLGSQPSDKRDSDEEDAVVRVASDEEDPAVTRGGDEQLRSHDDPDTRTLLWV